jgi:hypothetical protein
MLAVAVAEYPLLALQPLLAEQVVAERVAEEIR